MEPNCTIHQIEIYPADSAIHLSTFGDWPPNPLIIIYGAMLRALCTPSALVLIRTLSQKLEFNVLSKQVHVI